MASPQDKALKQFEVDLDKFGKDQMKIVGMLQRRSTFAIMRDVVRGSPVDTGRFRASWMIGIGQPDRSMMPAKVFNKMKGKFGEKKRARNKRQTANGREASATSLDRLKLVTPETVKGDEPIIISNNLPYANVLADGSSKQAPSGWIEAAVERARKESGDLKISTDKLGGSQLNLGF